MSNNMNFNSLLSPKVKLNFSLTSPALTPKKEQTKTSLTRAPLKEIAATTFNSQTMNTPTKIKRNKVSGMTLQESPKQKRKTESQLYSPSPAVTASVAASHLVLTAATPRKAYCPTPSSAAHSAKALQALLSSSSSKMSVDTLKTPKLTPFPQHTPSSAATPSLSYSESSFSSDEETPKTAYKPRSFAERMFDAGFASSPTSAALSLLASSPSSSSSSSNEEDDGFDLSTAAMDGRTASMSAAMAAAEASEKQKSKDDVGDVIVSHSIGANGQLETSYSVPINGVIYPLRLLSDPKDGRWHDVYEFTGNQMLASKENKGLDGNNETHVSRLVWKCPKTLETHGYKEAAEKAASIYGRNRDGYKHLKDKMFDNQKLIPTVVIHHKKGCAMEKMHLRAEPLMAKWAHGEDVTKWNDTLPEKQLLNKYKAYLAESAQYIARGKTLSSDGYMHNWMGSADGRTWKQVDIDEPEDDGNTFEVFQYLLYAAQCNRTVWDFMKPESLHAEIEELLQTRRSEIKDFKGDIPPSKHENIGKRG